MPFSAPEALVSVSEAVVHTFAVRADAWYQAEKRVKLRESCGKRGFVASYRQKHSDKLLHRFIPIRCKSILCPYCAWIDSRKRLKAIRNLLEAVKEPVAFLTLTFQNFSNPIEAVNYAIKVKRKFYSFRIFGKKKWLKVKQKALELLEAYLNNIEDVSKREQKRKFHLWAIQKFEQAWADQLYNSKTKFYLGRLLRSVWKFEITYNSSTGWHPHWHVLVLGYFPLFVLQAVWVMCGGGEVVDIRLAKSVESVAEYVAKYEAKPVVSLEGQDLSYELQLALEASLYGRKLFETWGLSELRQEEDVEYEFVGVARGVRCELELDNLHNLPNLVELLRKQSRDGPVLMFLCKAKVIMRERIGDEVLELVLNAGAYLDKAGRIWLVGDERYDRFASLWTYSHARDG